MLDVILKLLSFLGIILLALILLLLAVLLLVLFFPVTYKFHARKTAEKTELSAGMNWLFGLLRVRCSYPEPGILTAKLLWFKLYQTKLPPDDKEHKEKAGQAEEKDAGPNSGGEPESREGSGPDGESGAGAEIKSGMESKPDTEGKISGEPVGARKQAEPDGEGIRPAAMSQQGENRQEEARNGFFEKFNKIKYTICNIYDKIKEIWKNISYYTALLQEENTRKLWIHVKLRAAKVLKNIRPRHIRADILFGTGSPDTTGYVFGMYCMLYPVLGTKVLATPDFERAVLEGRLDIAGHITVFVLAANVVRLMMDRKLQAFVRKLKKEEMASQKDAASHETVPGRKRREK